MDEMFNGWLMSRDIPIAKIENDIIQALEPQLLPLFFKRCASLKMWLETRAIDRHRTNSRLLRRALRLSEYEDTDLVLSVHAATITDTYWVKPLNSKLTYADIKFKENYFADISLRGNTDDFIKASNLRDSERKNSPIYHTPELTNIGSYEKCWKLENGQWWIYKQATPLELFSELFIYELGKALNFPMAMYRADKGYSKSCDFTGGANVNFEPAHSLVIDDVDYVKNYKVFSNYGVHIADQYLQILMLDAFCLNMDRHEFNYGVLRDVQTGKVLSMAPNYDNNLALISRGYPSTPENHTILHRDLETLEEETQAFTNYRMRHKLPIVTPQLIKKCIDKVDLPVNEAFVTAFVMNGYKATPAYRLQKQELSQTHSICEFEI